MLYHITTEPRGQTYRRLIDLSMHFCDSALLVVRDNIGLDSSGIKILETLGRFVKQKIKSSRWPGTILLCNELFPDNVATLYYFQLCIESAEILKSSVECLYSWRQPEYPEDLCLLRPDGGPWLVSIAHEGDSYLQLAPEEKEDILVRIPELGPLTVRNSEDDQ